MKYTYELVNNLDIISVDFMSLIELQELANRLYVSMSRDREDIGVMKRSRAPTSTASKLQHDIHDIEGRKENH